MKTKGVGVQQVGDIMGMLLLCRSYVANLNLLVSKTQVRDKLLSENRLCYRQHHCIPASRKPEAGVPLEPSGFANGNELVPVLTKLTPPTHLQYHGLLNDELKKHGHNKY